MSNKGSLRVDNEADQRTTVIEFGNRLRATREAAEISQKTLDARCFFGEGVVSKFERGCRSPPGLFVILRLAAGLGVDPGILLDGLPVPRRSEGIGNAISLIANAPGLTTSVLMDKMGVSRTYVVRLVKWLSAYGVITNYQGGWALAGTDDDDSPATTNHVRHPTEQQPAPSQ